MSTANQKSAVIKETGTPVTASIIWLHGLGADGHDFAGITPALQLPKTVGIRFIFPHAPVRPVTISMGFPVRAWYDIYSLTDLDREDTLGIQTSHQKVSQLIEQEIESGVAADRIILAGFSQGGAMALYTGLRFPKKLAGVLGLSCYLPLHKSLETEQSIENQSTPILLMHGQQDDVLPIIAGEKSYACLESLGYPVTWKHYPMGHEVCPAQLIDIGRWLSTRLTTTHHHS